MSSCRTSQTKYNLAIVGGGAVGKSALTIQFIQHIFCDEYDPTIEDQHRKQILVDDQPAILELIDTAGQEELTAMRDQYIRSAEGFLIVFSLCSLPSFTEAVQLYSQICRVKDSQNVPIILVGNKSDVPNRTVLQVDIDDFVSKLADKDVKYIEASAKQRINVDECFHELVRTVRKKKGSRDIVNESPAKVSRISKHKQKLNCTLL